MRERNLTLFGKARPSISLVLVTVMSRSQNFPNVFRFFTLSCCIRRPEIERGRWVFLVACLLLGRPERRRRRRTDSSTRLTTGSVHWILRINILDLSVFNRSIRKKSTSPTVQVKKKYATSHRKFREGRQEGNKWIGANGGGGIASNNEIKYKFKNLKLKAEDDS